MVLKLPAVTGTLEMYIAEINRISLLSAEEEFSLAVKLKKYNGIKEAEKLVVSNLRFVVKIAYEYKNYNVKLADLIQEGNIGLMHAVKKFDPYKGYRLISLCRLVDPGLHPELHHPHLERRQDRHNSGAAETFLQVEPGTEGTGGNVGKASGI